MEARAKKINSFCEFRKTIKEGDRVQIVGQMYPDDPDYKGAKLMWGCINLLKGTIISLDNITLGEFAIEFDEYTLGHDCEGKGKPGCCTYIYPSIFDEAYIYILKKTNHNYY